MKFQISLAFALLFFNSVLADGPVDNRLDKVRPIPPAGKPVSAQAREELEEGLSKLGSEIEALQASLKSKPSQLALLPDIQIFHKAVRYALRYNEIFNPTNEVPAAKAAIQQ